MKLSPYPAIARWLTWLCITLVLAACSSTGRVIDHSFGFEITGAVPAVEVIDYRYGISGLPGARAPEWMVEQGKPSGGTGVSGLMTVGDFLYVKWRIKQTGEVFEENVDLRHRLPRDIKDHKVNFYIIGPQLYVYVTDANFLPKEAPNVIPAGAPSQYLPGTLRRNYRIIYPDQPKK